MTEEQYKRKCDALFNKAKSIGVELSFHPESFDMNRLNCLWYGGGLAVIKVSETLSVTLDVCGDVYAELLDKNGEYLAYVKDKANAGRFYDEMHQFIENDEELSEALDDGRLKLDYNNWVEYDGVFYKNKSDTLGEFIDLGLIVDNLLDDDILTAIDEALDRITEIVQEIKTVGGIDDA